MVERVAGGAEGKEVSRFVPSALRYLNDVMDVDGEDRAAGWYGTSISSFREHLDRSAVRDGLSWHRSP